MWLPILLNTIRHVFTRYLSGDDNIQPALPPYLLLLLRDRVIPFHFFSAKPKKEGRKEELHWFRK